MQYQTSREAELLADRGAIRAVGAIFGGKDDLPDYDEFKVLSHQWLEVWLQERFLACNLKSLAA